MYEELIATLRESRDKRMLDAADAIEELQQTVERRMASEARLISAVGFRGWRDGT